jgi:hypothetical protein
MSEEMTYQPTILGTAVCPQCNGKANIIGGYNAVDNIECECGYSCEQFEEDGIVYNGERRPGEDMAEAYVRCIEETNARVKEQRQG